MPPKLRIKLMDADLCKCGTVLVIDAEERAPRIERDGQFYEAAEQADAETWLYRHRPHTK